MKQLELSEKNDWKSTLKLADATLSMLSAFDGRHIESIDAAIDSLCKILAMGDNLDDIAKIYFQQQKQENKNRTTIPPYDFFNGIADDDEYQRHLQMAVKLSIEEYNISQRNVHLYKDKLQNKQSPEYYNINAEYDYAERQLAQDTETAINLSLDHEIKKKKTYETDIYGGAPALAQRDDLSTTNKNRTNSKSTSNPTALKSKDLVRTPTSENGNKLDIKAT